MIKNVILAVNDNGGDILASCAVVILLLHFSDGIISASRSSGKETHRVEIIGLGLAKMKEGANLVGIGVVNDQLDDGRTVGVDKVRALVLGKKMMWEKCGKELQKVAKCLLDVAKMHLK